MWPPASFRIALYFIAAGWSVCDAVHLSDPGSSIHSPTAQQSQDAEKPKPGASCRAQLAYGASKLEKYKNSEKPVEITITMLNETEAAIVFGDAFNDCYKRRLKKGVSELVFGALFVLLAVSIQWFNEERSAKMNVLISRGLSDCEHVDANDLSKAHRGKLVHVQGKTRAAHPIVDDRFSDAKVTGCLKLQSTVEVCDWMQTKSTYLDEKSAKFRTEWTTEQNGRRCSIIKTPSPDKKPGLPSGLALGTATKKCTRVELGAFALTEDMITNFHKFEPALKYLPSKLVSHGLTFFANTSDGYYYSRPSESIPGGETSPAPTLFTEPQVGDLRIRFLCVPESEATVVAVQCEKEKDLESFVPYRPTSRPGRCCCGCVCNLVAFSCKEESITEEIFYVSDSLETKEKPFECVGRRNPYRVWVWRVFGWVILYVGILLVLLPFSGPRGKVRKTPVLAAYGRGAPFVLAAITTVACSAFIMACTYAFYKPFLTFKLCCVVGVTIAAPLVYGTWG